MIHVELCEGLEQIYESAFEECESLTSITIPSTVEVIESFAFRSCTELSNVRLHEGLKKIDAEAFAGCLSLEQILIPSTVTKIHPATFKDCEGLEAIVFCDEIEAFLSRSPIRVWWDNGLSKKSLRMYSFLAQCNIPERYYGEIKAAIWKNDIDDLLRKYPDITERNLESYCNSIHSKLHKLASYEKLKDCATLLELAIWKAIICKHHTSAVKTEEAVASRLQHRLDCGASVIIPNVLPFLLKIDFTDTGASIDGSHEEHTEEGWTSYHEEEGYYNGEQDEDD